MKVFAAMVMAAALCITGLVNPTRAAEEGSKNQNESPKLVATREALRNLWTDHIFWVRAAVVAQHDKNADAQKVAEAQVVENARQIANSIEPFYGKQASQQLFGLLAGHWGAIKAYLVATDNGDDAAADAAQKALLDNAHQIAKFLSSANSNWPYDTVDQMLVTHGKHHVAQIQDIYKGDYKAEAKVWSEMRQHMNELSDALGNGLSAQFPDKF